MKWFALLLVLVLVTGCMRAGYPPTPTTAYSLANPELVESTGGTWLLVWSDGYAILAGGSPPELVTVQQEIDKPGPLCIRVTGDKRLVWYEAC